MALRSSEATLSLTLEDEDGQTIERVAGAIPLYAELSAAELDSIVESIQKRYPEAKDIGREPPSRPETPDVQRVFGMSLNSFLRWEPPTAEEIAAYQKAYAVWTDKLRKRIIDSGRLLSLTHRVRKIHLLLDNTGARPADEVLVEFTTYGEVRFLTSVGDETPDLISQVEQFAREVHLPAPPVPPKGEYLHERITRNSQRGLFGEGGLGRHLLPDFSSATSKIFKRDRHEFYPREDDDKPVTAASFGCQEFRHQRDRQRFSLWLIAPAQTEPVRASLHVRVSARNMATPIERHAPIEFKSDLRPAYAIAAKWPVDEKAE